MKKFNIYYLFDVLLALALVFFFLSRKDIRFLYGTGIFVIITIILVWLEMREETQLTQTVITNNSENAVMVKPESGAEPEEVKPHASVEGVDGINVAGKVFKACSGTHVVINKNGRITTKALSGKVANFVRGGYISTPPDPAWDKLFNQ